MWVGIVTLFPEMVAACAGVGVVGRAVDQGIVALEVVNPRRFTRDRHNTVDDRPYGGGPGMVMMAQPLQDAVAEARRSYASLAVQAADKASVALVTRPADVPVAYLSPAGETLTQAMACELAELNGLILVAGRYEGVDERFSASVDRHISIGDYVLSGGELPALVVLDAIARQLPGTLGNAASAIEESHLDGLLDYPHYTRPENAASGERVPAVLLSGDHRAIQRWRLQQALWRTWLYRPDLLANRPLSAIERELLAEKLNDDGVATTTS